MVGVLLISYRDGKYYIIDGQHRQVLLQMQGVEETLCQIITGLTHGQFRKTGEVLKDLSRVWNCLDEDIRIKISVDICNCV